MNLLLANAGLNVVASAGVDRRKADSLPANWQHRSGVEVDNSSGVTIPSLVISKLEAGTGFGFDLRLAIPRLDELPEEKKIHVLRSGQQALTCLGHPGRVARPVEPETKRATLCQEARAAKLAQASSGRSASTR